MDLALTLISLLLVFAAGLGCLGWLCRGWKFRVEEAFAYSWLLGAFFVSMSTFLLGQFLSGEALKTAVSLASVALGFQGAKRIEILPLELPKAFLNRLLLVAVVLEAAFMGWYSSRQYFGWDGLLVWEVKARVAFLNGGMLPAEFFRDPRMQWCQPDYPLLLPLLESWVYSWVGACSQPCLGPIFPLFFFAAMALLGSGVARLSGKSAAGFLAALLPLLVPFVVRRDGGVLSGYADWPLGVYYLAGLMNLLLFLQEGSRAHLRIFAATSAALPWIKAEGTVLWGALALGSLVAAGKSLRGQSVLLWLPGMVSLGMWRGFRYLVHALPSKVFLPVSVSTLVAQAHRLGAVTTWAPFEMGNIAHWSLFWYGVALAVIQLCLLSRLDLRIRLLIGISLLVPLACYLLVYPFSALPSYSLHFWTSFPRLILQLAPAGILVLVLAAFGLRNPKSGRERETLSDK